MKKLVIFLLVVTALGTGCHKILDHKRLPGAERDDGIHFRAGGRRRAAGSIQCLQNASYYGTDYTLLCDLEADNLDHTGSFPQYEQVKNRDDQPQTIQVPRKAPGIRSTGASIGPIRLSRLSRLITDPSFDSAAAHGEARFLRAFMYFDVMRYWGGTPSGYSDPNGEGVPLVLTPTFTAVGCRAACAVNGGSRYMPDPGRRGLCDRKYPGCQQCWPGQYAGGDGLQGPGGDLYRQL